MHASAAALTSSKYELASCSSVLTMSAVSKINRPTAGLDLNVPFGGVKDSSTNTFREQGRTALEFFSWGKTVYTGVEPSQPHA